MSEKIPDDFPPQCIEAARMWWGDHKRHVGALIRNASSAYPPTGTDRYRPELWKDSHWAWLDKILKA